MTLHRVFCPSNKCRKDHTLIGDLVVYLRWGTAGVVIEPPLIGPNLDQFFSGDISERLPASTILRKTIEQCPLVGMFETNFLPIVGVEHE